MGNRLINKNKPKKSLNYNKSIKPFPLNSNVGLCTKVFKITYLITFITAQY